MTKKSGKRGDYEVGYGKPPKHTQFKTGQSGNPGGKTAGTRGIKTDLEAALNAKSTIMINGKKFTGTNQQNALLTMAMRAGSGDLKANAILLPFSVNVLGTEDRGIARKQLSAHDQALLAELIAEATPSDTAASNPGPSSEGEALDDA